MRDWADTRRFSVDVHFGEGDHLSGELHLQPLGVPGQEDESPLDLLNRAEPFFALCIDAGDVRLVGKTWVEAVGIDPQRTDPSWGQPLAVPHPVQVRMASDATYRGHVDIELPPPGARTLDFLNQPEPFFALVADGRIWCLNRHQVLWVRPQD